MRIRIKKHSAYLRTKSGKRYYADENGNIHAVVLEGYLSAHINGGTYMLMDPNYEGYRGVSINAGVYSGNTGFTYSSVIGNYTWIDSICSA